jgi:hypothetical protein
MFKFMLFGYVSEHVDTYKMTMFMENLMIHLKSKKFVPLLQALAGPGSFKRCTFD